ncbi:MAG: apolipoprotein N-acyltransferase [Alphaproteobacteria bacterium]|nr:apolipoprotein N-acyltransferase [Alphaproteobacteria bacterium]
MSVKIHINISDPRWEEYDIDFAGIVNATLRAARPHDKTENLLKKSSMAIAPWMPASLMGSPFGTMDRELSINLADDSKLRALNKKYRGKDKPTNVLSFETGDSELLGDIFIAFDTVERESREHGAESRDVAFKNHATHMIVHGVLHLLGYDHLTDSDADRMEALEGKILKSIDHRAESTDKNTTRKKSMLYALLSMLCGAIASLGFAPFYLWPFTILGIGVAYHLIFCERAKNMPYALCLMPFTFGAGYAVANFWWILHSIYVDPELAAQFAIYTVPGVIGIALVGGLIFAVPFWMTRFACRDSVSGIRHPECGWRRPIIFAAAWTFTLWLREWIFTGFPWNPIANIAMPSLELSNSMALWGALGLTFIIIGLTVTIADAIVKSIEHRAKSIDFLPIGIFGVLLLIGIGYGQHNIQIANRAVDSESPLIRMVQTGKSQEEKATHSPEALRARAAVNLAKLVDLSRAPGAPDIIIWPETSYPYMVMGDGDPDAVRFPSSKELGRMVIAGAMSIHRGPRGERQTRNSMIIADADGRISHIYSKFHLVPFGEYAPLGGRLPSPGQLTPGVGPEIINVAGLYFAPAICYEIIFSDSLIPRVFPGPGHLLRNFRDDTRVDAIINLTNDAWFGRTPGTFQHLDMTRRQAIEMGLPVVRANFSGISAFINADGRVVSYLPIGIAGTLDGRVGPSHVTPYRIIGRDWWMIIILLFSVLVVSFRKNRKTIFPE